MISTSSPFGAGRLVTGGRPAGNYIGILAKDRETLIALIRSFVGVFIIGRAIPLLEIRTPCCGEYKCYKLEVDIPVNDVGPCPCGNWFIRYEEQPLRVIW